MPRRVSTCFVGTVGLEPTTRVAFALFFFPAGFQPFMFSFLLRFYIILRRFCADFSNILAQLAVLQRLWELLDSNQRDIPEFLFFNRPCPPISYVFYFSSSVLILCCFCGNFSVKKIAGFYLFPFLQHLYQFRNLFG